MYYILYCRMEHRANLLWIPPDSDYNIKEVRKAAAKQGPVKKTEEKESKYPKKSFCVLFGILEGGYKKI